MTGGRGLLLTVNAGSSSLKLALFRHPAGQPGEALRIVLDLHRGHGGPEATVSGDEELRAVLALPATRDPAAFTTALLAGLAGSAPVSAVAHRIVHGGDETRECVALDAAERARLHALSPLAPLHQPPALAIVEAIAAACPALPQYACPDTAFHTTMPAVARDYALPAALRARHPALHAYGFHGLSCRSVVDRLRADGQLPPRLLVAHLGSGASMTAVRDGHGIATSMGFSALEGLPMATRPGRLDAGVLLYLLRHETADVDALEALLYRQSGLLGLSGESADLRVLLASTREAARHAVDFLVYRATLEAGALVAALGGLDALVFTGGVGEHQGVIRARIATGLGFLGTRLDTAANARHDTRISAADSPVAVHVLRCDEEAVMAAATFAALAAGNTPAHDAK